ncbi:hypothetical protein HYU21_02115, partial [Candidatus Woesearchaeota archaeon]|nr:hypothetical protein [Candidatus Woesearchaeota archaeon]
MAFILVAQNSLEITPEKVQRLQEIKDIYPAIFSTATLQLASIDTSYPITTFTLDQLSDNSLETITKTFYGSNPDQFDFISIFPATPEFSYLPTSYSPLQSFIQGIGTIPLNRDSSFFGSKGQLLGIGYYRDYLNEMDLVSAESSAKKILHETGHQWCCYAGASLGILNHDLPIHFYTGLDSEFDNGAYIGSWHWITNGDGTYRTNFKEVSPDKFHPFALYFM